METAEETESGYLFIDGKIIDFEMIMLNKIDFSYETGALRIRTTQDEMNVDFLAEIKPTKKQLDRIKKLKTPKRKLFFEIVDKDNKLIGCCGFDVSMQEMEEQLLNFYKNYFPNSQT